MTCVSYTKLATPDMEIPGCFFYHNDLGETSMLLLLFECFFGVPGIPLKSKKQKLKISVKNMCKDTFGKTTKKLKMGVKTHEIYMEQVSLRRPSDHCSPRRNPSERSRVPVVRHQNGGVGR